MLRKLYFSATLAVLFLPSLAGAASLDGSIPEFNPLCWTETQCRQARAELLGKSPEELQKMGDSGFVPNQDPCLGQATDSEGAIASWGKCLPAGVQDTQIAFGGRRRFLHLGDFIQTMYRYLIGIAGIVAVLVIIFAGYQYTTSGGNSEAITSAKKRLGGALMGLFLAYLSYLLLNILNPALVNLRLPQVWMIRSQKLVPQFCFNAPENMRLGKNFALAADTTDQITPLPAPATPPDYNLSLDPKLGEDNLKSFYCGKRFYINKGGATTCFGDYCDPGQLCVDFEYKDKLSKTKYYCAPGTVAGTIVYQKPISDLGCVVGLAKDNSGEGWNNPEIVDTELGGQKPETELWVVCKNGKAFDVGAGNNGSTLAEFQIYSLIAPPDKVNAAVGKCGGESQVNGFMLKFEMNETCDATDEDHWLGWDGQSRALDLGDDGVILGVGGQLGDMAGVYLGVWGQLADWRGKSWLNTEMQLSEIAKHLKIKYLIPLARIKRGVVINVDANGIYDIDDTNLSNVFAEDRSVYRKFYE